MSVTEPSLKKDLLRAKEQANPQLILDLIPLQ
jgi:hypothetical protein